MPRRVYSVHSRLSSNLQLSGSLSSSITSPGGREERGVDVRGGKERGEEGSGCEGRGREGRGGERRGEGEWGLCKEGMLR